jgi:hypothetical protein
VGRVAYLLLLFFFCSATQFWALSQTKNYWVRGTINKGVGEQKLAHWRGEGTRGQLLLCVCVSHVAQPPHESIALASFVGCVCLTCVHVCARP